MSNRIAYFIEWNGKRMGNMKTVLSLLMLVVGMSIFTANAESLMEKNQKAGAEFLEKNAKAEGVSVTASGLQYKVLSSGEENGAKPGATSVVTVNYEGRNLQGEVFDSSYKRNKPISFPLNRVIPGWTEGLQLMTVGSKYQLYIPAELAYGHRGAGRSIGPMETLIFDVELLSFE